MTFPFEPATKPQIRFIQSLSDDCGFDIKRRDAHIKSVVGRDCKPGGLSKQEASKVIAVFKDWKNNLKLPLVCESCGCDVEHCTC